MLKQILRLSLGILIISGCNRAPEIDHNNRGPILVTSVTTVYPEEARKKNVEGEVWVKMWVNEKGRVTRAMVEKTPDPSLAAAAMEAAMNTRYKPAMVDGKPTAVWLIVPIMIKKPAD